MSFYLIVLFAPMFVIVFWGIELLIGSLKRERTKQNLAFFMLCGFFSIISGVAFFLEQFKFYNHTYTLVVFFALSQFPAFFIYIYSLTRVGKFSYKIYFHYGLPIVAIISAIVIHVFWFNSEENLFFVSKILTGKVESFGKYKVAYYTDRVYKDLFIFSGIFYFWIINKQVKSYREKINNYFSNTENVSLDWMRIFNLLLFLALSAGIFFHAMNRDFFIKNPIMISIPYGILSLFYFAVGHFGSKQKNIYELKEEGFTLENDKEETRSLNSLTNDFKLKINELMLKDKPYLNHELSLPELAKITGTNRSYLSRFINENYQLNFKQYINDFRLNDAANLLKTNPQKEITEISYQCGFSSYHTFNRCFKSKFGTTPGKFRENN